MFMGKLNIINISILHKLIYRFDINSIKIPGGPFCRNWQVNFKIHTKTPGLRIIKTSVRKNKVTGPALSDFNTYWKVRVI